VPDPAVELYGAAFVARWSHEPGGEPVPPAQPGVRGLVWPGEEPSVRLLVTDDRGYDRLVTEVARARRGAVVVLDRARRCHDFLRSRPGWRADRPATAMVLRDVDAVPAVAVPDGLALRPVRRLASDAPGAVPLEDAVAVAIASDPGITDPPEEFARFLQGLPPSARLLAAVDGAGVAHATSGVDVFGEYARVFFVNTEPGRRRRGIGRALTAAALRAAASAGARRAVLHATDDGASVYARLGFEPAGRLTRYARTA
jgi:GNAT superfamily N-acetyltransferase